ncbi:MAG TPA: hypothetical protein VNK48_14480 [Xanthobacteraceae bacterium]|nr:hypothetical protein [Xanthobacteraceae bacterium]
MESPGDRLRKARAAKFRSARAAALAHGWVVSTYTSHENGTRAFEVADAQKYARAFGVSAAYLLGLSEENIGPSTPVKGVPVRGESAVGVWREIGVDFMPQAAEKFVVMPLARDAEEGSRFAVRVGDASVSKVFAVGEYAICQRLTEPIAARDMATGDLFLVERTKRNLKELTIRRVFARDEDRVRLATWSADPKFKNMASYPPEANGERVRIIARVVGRYAEL